MQEWIDSLPHTVRQEVKIITTICTNYLKENQAFFRNCGFYVVGSSLQKQDFDDIDFVLVGLDFREVFHYTPAFLDSNFLSEETKEKARDNGEHFSHYSVFQIECRPELAVLAQRITTVLPTYACDLLNDTPFIAMPYVHDSLGEWLVSRKELYHGKNRWSHISPLIDLMFHAENLLVSSWKQWQEREGLPYLPIIEFYDPAHDRLENRQTFDLPLPDFIDSEGKMHMKMKYWKEGHRKLMTNFETV